MLSGEGASLQKEPVVGGALSPLALANKAESVVSVTSQCSFSSTIVHVGDKKPPESGMGLASIRTQSLGWGGGSGVRCLQCLRVRAVENSQRVFGHHHTCEGRVKGGELSFGGERRGMEVSP